jgi:acetyl-CoA acetyltransferase
MKNWSSDVCIVGVGQTDFTRGSRRSNITLAVQAALAACADAGIDSSEIDGVLPPHQGTSACAEDLMANLRIRELKYSTIAYLGGASAVASLQSAALALVSGLCNYVLAVRARNGYSERTGANADFLIGVLPGSQFRRNFELPYGFSAPVQWYSLMAKRHMEEFGTTREQLGRVALAMRKHANLNPHAQMHAKELTMAQYLASRPISEPYHLLDCCLETDGGSAVILTTRDRARKLRHLPVSLAGIAEGHSESPDDLVNRRDWLSIGLTRAAPRAFDMAGLGPQDMDAAMIYDCFTFEVIQQLEESSFCPRGEGGRFVSGGNIEIGGTLPVNTHGGLLSEGHLSGMNHIVEAVQQLRGQCGSRQVENARHIFVSGWGDLGDGSAAVLRGAKA